MRQRQRQRQRLTPESFPHANPHNPHGTQDLAGAMVDLELHDAPGPTLSPAPYRPDAHLSPAPYRPDALLSAPRARPCRKC
jgi:hypothetical protein